jgi:hypothetical protein
MLTAATVALAALGGCAPPMVRLDTAGVKPSADFADLAAVLHRCVNSDGLLDLDAAAKCSDLLDAQVKKLAACGPDTQPALFPSSEDRLAYWYNARMAWELKLVVMGKYRDEPTPAQLEEWPFVVDGKERTLSQIDMILALDDDWRVVAAAPSVRLHRAELSDKPFEAAEIRPAVLRRYEKFLGDPRRWVIDIDRHSILVPPVLWRIHHAIIKNFEISYRTTGATLNAALGAGLSGPARRRLQDAVGYEAVEGPSNGPLAVVAKH